MINVSTAFKSKLFNDERDYIITADFTLKDGTQLSFDNESILNNGITIDDAVGSDSAFTALGGAVINTCDLTISDIDENYSQYEYEGATFNITIGLQLLGGVESFVKGTFIVDDAQYDTWSVKIHGVDYMSKFDKPYSESNLQYPASLQMIVQQACQDCGVLLQSNDFPHKSYIIPNAPVGESVTYRQVLSWVGQIIGCYFRCNRFGKLEANWFNTAAYNELQDVLDGGVFDTDSSSSYVSGDNANGGWFNPWNFEYIYDAGKFEDDLGVHNIFGITGATMDTDNIIITGVQIHVKNPDTTTSEEKIITFNSGLEGYMVIIPESNEFCTLDNSQEIVDWLGEQLIGVTFRHSNVNHLNDPTIEAGDIAIIYDRRRRPCFSLITRTNFKSQGLQTTVCGAETPSRRNYSQLAEVQNYIALRDTVDEQIATTRELIEDDFNTRMNSMSGMYETTVQEQSGGYTYYLHDKPTLNESQAVIKVTNEGVGVSATGPNGPWYGLTVDGTFLANVISTIDLFFDYAKGGTLTLGGYDNQSGLLQVLNPTGDIIGSISNSGIILQNAGVSKFCGATGAFYWGLLGSEVIWNSDAKGESTQIINEYGILSKSLFIDRLYHAIQDCLTTSSKYICKTTFLASDYTNINTEPTTGQLILNRIDYSNSTDCPYFSLSGKNQPRYRHTYDQWMVNIHRSEFALILNSGGYDSFLVKSNLHDKTRWNTYYTAYNTFVYITEGGFTFHCPNYYMQLVGAKLVVNGQNVAFESSSSKRYKNNISEQLIADLNPHKLYNLKLKQFKFKKDHKLQYEDMKNKFIPGFIAEDVADIYPAAVIHNEQGEIESWDERRILPPMLKLIQEQHEEIENLKSRVDKLEKLVEKLVGGGN